MLNVCGMSIDGSGRFVILDMRNQDVIDRWGVDHWKVDGAKRMKGIYRSICLLAVVEGAPSMRCQNPPGHEQLTN